MQTRSLHDKRFSSRGKALRMLAVGAAICVSRVALADDDHVEMAAPEFGAKGQWVVSDLYGASAMSTRAGIPTITTFQANPGLDYFFHRHLSIGGDIYLSHSSIQFPNALGFGGSDSNSVTTVAARVRVGYDIPLSERLSVYPRFTLGFERMESSTTVASFLETGAPVSTLPLIPNLPGTFAATGPTIDLFVPVLVHWRRFFVGFGPYFSVFFAEIPVFVQATQSTQQQNHAVESGGASFLVGGTIGGDASPPEDPPPPPTASYPHRFGEKHDLMIGSDFQVAASYMNTDSTAASVFGTNNQFAISFAPGADYFVTDNFSVGGSLLVSYSRIRAIGLATDAGQTTNDPVTFETTSLGAGARIRYNISINWWLSVYPRMTLSYTHVIDTGYDDYGQIGGSIPLLFHLVQHVFIGAGPTLACGFGPSIYQTCNYGAAATVGGWLHLSDPKSP